MAFQRNARGDWEHAVYGTVPPQCKFVRGTDHGDWRNNPVIPPGVRQRCLAQGLRPAFLGTGWKGSGSAEQGWVMCLDNVFQFPESVLLQLTAVLGNESMLAYNNMPVQLLQTIQGYAGLDDVHGLQPWPKDIAVFGHPDLPNVYLDSDGYLMINRRVLSLHSDASAKYYVPAVKLYQITAQLHICIANQDQPLDIKLRRRKEVYDFSIQFSHLDYAIPAGIWQLNPGRAVLELGVHNRFRNADGYKWCMRQGLFDQIHLDVPGLPATAGKPVKYDVNTFRQSGMKRIYELGIRKTDKPGQLAVQKLTPEQIRGLPAFIFMPHVSPPPSAERMMQLARRQATGASSSSDQAGASSALQVPQEWYTWTDLYVASEAEYSNGVPSQIYDTCKSGDLKAALVEAWQTEGARKSGNIIKSNAESTLVPTE